MARSNPDKDTRRKANAKAPKESTKEQIELRSDGFERFRKAVHAAAKSGPKPKKSNG